MPPQIRNQDLLDLKKLLCTLYRNSEGALRVFRDAGFDSAAVTDRGTPFSLWSELLEHAINKNKLLSLLEYIDREFEGHEILQKCIRHLRNGYRGRIESLATAIKWEQVVLFLGPDALLANEGSAFASFNKLVARALAAELDDHIFYDKAQSENLYYIGQRYKALEKYVSGGQGRIAQKLYEQFQQKNALSRSVSLFEMLSAFPFKLVVNLNPDDLLLRSYQKANKPYRHLFYDVSNDVASQPTIENLFEKPNDPIFYNLLGTFNKYTSIVASESELLNLVSRMILKAPAISPDVIRKFDKDTYYLFLGFDFDHWHIKIIFELILKLLKIENRGFSIFSDHSKYLNKSFYEDEFKFYFIDDDIESFLGILYEVYK